MKLAIGKARLEWIDCHWLAWFAVQMLVGRSLCLSAVPFHARTRF